MILEKIKKFTNTIIGKVIIFTSILSFLATVVPFLTGYGNVIDLVKKFTSQYKDSKKETVKLSIYSNLSKEEQSKLPSKTVKLYIQEGVFSDIEMRKNYQAMGMSERNIDFLLGVIKRVSFKLNDSSPEKTVNITIKDIKRNKIDIDNEKFHLDNYIDLYPGIYNIEVITEKETKYSTILMVPEDKKIENLSFTATLIKN